MRVLNITVALLSLQLQHTDQHVLYTTSNFEAGITTILNLGGCSYEPG